VELKHIRRTLLRRWYLTVTALLMAALAGFGAFSAVGPTYSAGSTVVLIPPQVLIERQQASGSYAPANPLLYLGGLTDARDVVLRNLASKEVLDRIDAQAPGVTFTATNDALSSGPLVVIEVEASTAADALKGMTLISKEVPVVLADFQKGLGVADNARITSTVVTSDTAATAIRKKQIQSTGFSVAGVLVVLLLLIAFVDGVVTNRSGQARRGSGPSRRRPISSPTTNLASTEPGAVTAAPGSLTPRPRPQVRGREPAPTAAERVSEVSATR
jgi:hypothetical protein